MTDTSAHREQRAVAPVQSGDLLAEKYLVERVLGVGGMGVVVAAQHRFLGGRVALKFVLPELAQDTNVVERFLTEAQSATRITSEHVARVTDVGVLENGAPYMVMEYLEGDDLNRILKQRGPLPVGEVVDYVLQASQAIAEAHAKGIVHRDLKPANLFLTRRADGTPLVKVLDFGIAKAIVTDSGQSSAGLTGTKNILGSPQYMSPEQIRAAKSVDARSDVWAVGVILYELLTGTLPFGGEDVGAVLASILTDPAPFLREGRSDAPEALERVILGCLEKDRSRRIQSVADIAAAIAPYGSADARLSLSRIAGILGVPGSVSGSSSTDLRTPSVDAVLSAVAPGVTAPATGPSNWGGTIGAASPTGHKSPARKGPLVVVVLGAVAMLCVGGLIAHRVIGGSGVSTSAEPQVATSVAPPVSANAIASAAPPVPVPSASAASSASSEPSVPASASEPAKPTASRVSPHPPGESKPGSAQPGKPPKSSLDNLIEQRR